jgi:hypothetical protein
MPDVSYAFCEAFQVRISRSQTILCWCILRALHFASLSLILYSQKENPDPTVCSCQHSHQHGLEAWNLYGISEAVLKNNKGVSEPSCNKVAGKKF